MKGVRVALMKYLEARFRCRLSTPAQFSAYKGSMLRGALGASLRKGLCMTRARDCAACILAKDCLFPRLFSPLPGAEAPPPFCLEPDMDAKASYKAGESFEFALRLFAYGVDYLPFFIQAWRMAGENGLGSRREPGQFVIEEVSSKDQVIYTAQSDNLSQPQSLDLPDCEEAAENAGQQGVGLRLLTPLRHKADNHFSASLEFVDLLHLILRRIRALYVLEGRKWALAREQYELLRQKAASIRIAANNLRWHDWTRYSSRQKAYMQFGGLAGEISYLGDVGPFANFLSLAAIAHIGKQTSFGLGRIGTEYF